MDTNYDAQEVTRAVRYIEQGKNDPTGQIIKLFEGIVQLVADNNRRGCLLCTTLVENEDNDPDIARAAMASLARMRTAFQNILEQEFSKDQSVALAHLLTTQYLGMRLFTRTQMPVESFQQNLVAIKRILAA
ncbi:MAG: hypothetical protein AAFW66_05370 [Pseudomonadota bacterium]